MNTVDRKRIEADIFLDKFNRDQRNEAESRAHRSAPWVLAGLVAGGVICWLGLPEVGVLLIAAAIGLGILNSPPRESRVRTVMTAASNVQAVECPKCHAATGERCALPALDMRICHEERGRLYWRERGAVQRELGAAL